MCELLRLLPPVPVIPADAPYADAAEEFIIRQLSKRWMPPEKIPPEEWFLKNLRLSANQSADYAGEPLDLRRTPHARLILDFLLDPEAKELSIMKSSAAALSTTVIGMCVYILKHKPRNILYLISNKEEAVKLSKQVWQPFLRQVFGDEVDTEEQANLHLHINGVEVFAGSPTENLLRNKQVGIVIEDESDTMSDTLIGGGQSLEIAQKERTKNTRGAKIIRLCSPLYKYDPKRPKVSQTGTRIHKHYLRGDQREYRVPCPKCEAFTPLRTDDLVYDHCRLFDGTYDLDRVAEETHWRCPLCAHVVHEGREKAAMVNSGRWEATNLKPERRSVWSAKHTDLAALIGQATWGYIMAELLRTKGTAEEIGVRRSHLAEPEDLQNAGAERDRESILRHCGTHERGVCPIPAWHILLTVDVQKDCKRFPWMITAVAVNGDSYVIDWGEADAFSDLYVRDVYGKIHGLIVEPIPLRLPSSVEAREFPDGGAPPYVYVSRALIDSGYRARDARVDESDGKTESVYEFCKRTAYPPENRYLFVPVKGQGGKASTRKALTVDSCVEFQGIHLPLHLYDDNHFKRDLYNVRLPSDPKNPDELARERGRIVFPRLEDIDEDLIFQLSTERIYDREIKKANGRKITVPMWDNPDGPNDLGDCLKWVLIFYNIMQRQLQEMANAEREAELAESAGFAAAA
jgi:hypothetical protein